MAPRPARVWASIALVALASSVSGCRLDRRLVRPEQAAQLERGSPFLKAHLRDGGVVVFSDWQVDDARGLVRGHGQRYDMNRLVTASGPLLLAIGEVALFETNQQMVNAGTVAAITLVTVPSVALSVICLTQDKACFGSCPTVYAPAGEGEALMAEAFSASVAPALEAVDIDALFRARPKGRTVTLRVTNEALETHVVREAQLLAAPRPKGGRVLATAGGRLLEARALRPPSACRAEEGSCLEAVRNADSLERWNRTDGKDLATREVIELAFAPTVGPAGLMIEARQTFITTYLLYQALAYMGTRAGVYLAALERGDPRLLAKAAGLHRLLGAIEVQAPDGRGGWRTVGGFDETGPIASDVQVVPLPAGVRGDRLRLRLTRGHWRIGTLALAELGAAVAPAVLRPSAIRTTSGDAAGAAAWLAGRRPTLVTGPGDAHALVFELPAAPEGLELFLHARGYYLEWMREPWLAEESAVRLALLFEQPALALRQLAPGFRRIEAEIEQAFWSSRYVSAPPR